MWMCVRSACLLAAPTLPPTRGKKRRASLCSLCCAACLGGCSAKAYPPPTIEIAPPIFRATSMWHTERISVWCDAIPVAPPRPYITSLLPRDETSDRLPPLVAAEVGVADQAPVVDVNSTLMKAANLVHMLQAHVANCSVSTSTTSAAQIGAPGGSSSASQAMPVAQASAMQTSAAPQYGVAQMIPGQPPHPPHAPQMIQAAQAAQPTQPTRVVSSNGMAAGTVAGQAVVVPSGGGYLSQEMLTTMNSAAGMGQVPPGSVVMAGGMQALPAQVGLDGNGVVHVRGGASTKSCIHPGCTKGAIGKLRLCIAHGGGKRCSVNGCNKAAQGQKPLCKAHGGGRRCKFEGCPRSARDRTDLCIGHGGGKRCLYNGCETSARSGTLYCSLHDGVVRKQVPGGSMVYQVNPMDGYQ